MAHVERMDRINRPAAQGLRVISATTAWDNRSAGRLAALMMLCDSYLANASADNRRPASDLLAVTLSGKPARPANLAAN